MINSPDVNLAHSRSGGASPSCPTAPGHVGEHPMPTPYLPLWTINQDTDWRSRLNLFGYEYTTTTSTAAQQDCLAFNDTPHAPIGSPVFEPSRDSAPSPTTSSPIATSGQTLDTAWTSCLDALQPTSVFQNATYTRFLDHTTAWPEGLATTAAGQQRPTSAPSLAQTTDGVANMLVGTVQTPLLTPFESKYAERPVNAGSNSSLSFPAPYSHDLSLFPMFSGDMNLPDDVALDFCSEWRQKSRAQLHFIVSRNSTPSDGIPNASDGSGYRTSSVVRCPREISAHYPEVSSGSLVREPIFDLPTFETSSYDSAFSDAQENRTMTPLSSFGSDSSASLFTPLGSPSLPFNGRDPVLDMRGYDRTSIDTPRSAGSQASPRTVPQYRVSKPVSKPPSSRNKSGKGTSISDLRCKFCAFPSSRKKDVARHEATHQKENMGKCVCLCGREYGRKDNLQRHQKTCRASRG